MACRGFSPFFTFKETVMRAGIIGIGKLGSIHLRILRELPEVGSIVLADSNPRSFAGHPEANFTDYKKLGPLIDLAIIASPTSTHYEIAGFFLKRHIPVLVEKPVTTTAIQARRLLSLARKNKTSLFVGHVERFNSAYLAAKDLLARPRFIECHRLSPYPRRSLDIGVVLDLMIHDLDIILDIVKDEVKKIEAVGVRVLSDHEDIANARLTFKNGCIANITASRISQETMRKFRVFGHNCYVSLDYAQQKVELYKKMKSAIEKKELSIQKEEPLKKEDQEFISHVIKKKFSLSSGEKAKNALELAIKISTLIKNRT